MDRKKPEAADAARTRGDRAPYEAPRLRRVGRLREVVKAAGAATNLDGAFFNS
jgi:hypothetical protein